MLKKLLNALLIFICILANGQDLSSKHSDKMLKINDLVQLNRLSDAENLVLELLPIQNLDQNFYKNAEIVLDNAQIYATSIDNKMLSLNNLIKVYDLYDLNFSINKNRNTVKKALLLYDNKMSDNNTIFRLLDAKFKTNKTDFVNAKEINLYFKLFYESKFKSRIPENINEFIETYVLVNEQIFEKQNQINIKLSNDRFSENQIKNLQIENLALELTNKNIQSYTDSYLSCENLSDYCRSNLEKNANNDSWLKILTEKLFQKNCFSNEIFNKLAFQSNKFNVTSKSCLYLGYSYLNNNQKENALQFFNEAADLEFNVVQKANIYYTIATNVFGINNKQQSVNYLEKAIATNNKFGLPYIYLAELYKNCGEECFKNDFEIKALNLLIFETYKKAIIADSDLEKQIKNLMIETKKNTPNNLDIKKAKMVGKTITIGCWINKSIEIPRK